MQELTLDQMQNVIGGEGSWKCKLLASITFGSCVSGMAVACLTGAIGYTELC